MASHGSIHDSHIFYHAYLFSHGHYIMDPTKSWQRSRDHVRNLGRDMAYFFHKGLELF